MDIKLPSLGEGADSGTVVNLFVKDGDSVRKNQPILELENEKAVASIPATADGTVTKVYIKIGDKLSVGQRILTLSETGGEPASPTERSMEAPPSPSRPTTAKAEGSHSRDVRTVDEAENAESMTVGLTPAASPSIRKLANELGIDLRRVRGSERGGRIVMADLRAYLERLQKLADPAKGTPKSDPSVKPPAEQIDFSKWGEVLRKPLSLLRQVISRRMAESWMAVPRVTQFDEADITALQELRKRFAPAYDEQGTRLTLTPFLLKSVVNTLRKHPIFNSSLDDATAEIVFKQYYHIGIAVETDAGLMVPVIRDADKKSLLELSRELETLAQKARERKVTPDQLKGGTFTLSNQGGIGGGHFTPIVNKPEVAILGLGRGAWKPVIREMHVVPRMMLPLALSYDHRVIDGGSAARFMVDLVGEVEGFQEDIVKLS